MEADKNLPGAPDSIMQYSLGYAPLLIINAAVENSIFDSLDSGPKTAEELASDSNASLRGVRSAANALASLSLLNKDDFGAFSLTPESSKYLVSSKPDFLGPMLRHSVQLLPQWMKIADVVRTGLPASPVNNEATGGEFFKDFVEALFPTNYPTAKALGEYLEISDLLKDFSVLDLAAGSGVWSIALAQQSPHVVATAVDWKDVVEVTRKMVRQRGLEKQFSFIEGDIQQVDFPKEQDLVLLGHILHSEGAERSRALLKKAHGALKPGATLAIAEWLVDEPRVSPRRAAIFSVNMLVNTEHGDVFTFNEISGWLLEAGFVDPKILDCPGASNLIVAVRA